ncbi:hypothetical protein EKO23_02075 [Nocardioides guangzhouensis]|uniref:Esterase-like activity of phytase family protein n=1 Tax=Nocardioides guangzhouensis TaxID=2497878 RepID=A0A4Q4ZK36_9ACTN|nr:hypothetical protein [Nocardioides guangzhouensis]RYP88693.1 hypothetical protein EKO23_02075 [Nocardioides guangzhouensis]
MFFRPTVAAAAVLSMGLLGGLTSCGEETSSSAPDPAASSTRTATDDPSADTTARFDAGQPWVARFEFGGDEVANGAAYVRFDPATGDTQVTKVIGPPEDYTPNPYLLVDAGRTVAVRANAASIKEERTGTLRLHPLDGARPRTVDLRAVTGVAGLHPIGWAFDPITPGLLRVLDRSGRLFEYDVAAGTATEGDAVTVGKGWELAPQFDSADGMPLLRNKRTWEYQKGGPYAAGGVRLTKTDRSPCPARTTLARTITDSDGTAWSACLADGKVLLFTQAEGEDGWTRQAASAADVPRGTMTLTWVLPTVA